MGNAQSNEDLAWFKEIMTSATSQSSGVNDDASSAYFDSKTLTSYLVRHANVQSLSLLDAQACVFIAFWTAKSMVSIQNTDIDKYGRAFKHLFQELNEISSFTRIIPEWLTDLFEACEHKQIASAQVIVQVFEDHHVNHKLHYCKTHQGLPVLITAYADCSELNKYKPSPPPPNAIQTPREGGSVTAVELPGQLGNMTENFIARGRSVVITREKYNGQCVVNYRLTKSNLREDERTIKEELNRYLDLRSRLDSEFVNPLLGTIDIDGASPCLVMEDNTTTSLFQYLTDASVFKQYLSWAKKLRIAYSIAQGLKYLHSNGVIHKLLSPYTVLMTPNLSVKLTCFGMGNVDQTTGTNGGCCTLAPEIRGDNTGYSFASDIYAFGLILMELAGYSVYKNNRFGELLAMSTTTSPKWYQQLVVLCTQKEANDRPSIDDVLTELHKHLYFYPLDMPTDSVILMELQKEYENVKKDEDKDKLKQFEVINSNSNDIVDVYGGKYGEIEVLIKRPKNAPQNKNIIPVHHLFNELVISTRVQSQNIVNQYGVIDSNTTSPGVIIAKMNLGSLFDYIPRIEDKATFSDDTKLHTAISIAQALVDLHDMDYVHCDVHSSNVFLDSSRQVKLGNLLLTQPEGLLLSDVLFEFVHYLAPEVKKGSSYSKAADVYAFGKLLIALDLCEQDAPEEYKLTCAWSEELVTLCCCDDPKKRPTMSTVVKRLKSFKSDTPPNFLNVRLRDAVDISGILKTLPAIEIKNLVYGTTIGSGAFGSIQKGIYNGEEVAIKVFREGYEYNTTLAMEFAREATTLHLCQSSEFVVKLIGVYADKRQLIMELMDGDLSGYIAKKSPEPEKFAWSDRISIALQLVSAIRDLHKLGIVHLDVKSLNFLYAIKENKLVLKLADFGQARVIQEEWGDRREANEVAKLGIVGTPGWKPPEVINKRVHVQVVEKIDIYALGVMFYELESLKSPLAFGNMPIPMFERLIAEGKYKYQFPDSCPYAADAKACLITEPRRRPSAEALLRKLEDISKAFSGSQ